MADVLNHNRPPPIPALVRPRSRLRARGQLPVRAIKRTETAGQPTFNIAGKDSLNLWGRGRPQVAWTELVDHELVEELDHARDFRSGQAHVLVRAVVRFSVRQHPEGGHQLFKRMGLRLPGCVDMLRPKRAVLDNMVDPQGDRQWHAKLSLKLWSTKNRGKAVDAKTVAKDALEAKLKVSRSIGQPTGHGAPVPRPVPMRGRESPPSRIQKSGHVSGDYHRGGDVIVDALVLLPPANSHCGVQGARRRRRPRARRWLARRWRARPWRARPWRGTAATGEGGDRGRRAPLFWDTPPMAPPADRVN